ncbi:hypothetical protein DFH09DRAFT_1366822 [Mycena vulgaris]|nr:hypothetical protein DFH09DRAFT_1366822 [Mycena vulgaris]
MTTQLEPSLARENATPPLSSRVARPPPYTGHAHESAPTRLYLSVRRVLAALIARPHAILSPSYMQSAVPLRAPRAAVCSFVSSFVWVLAPHCRFLSAVSLLVALLPASFLHTSRPPPFLVPPLRPLSSTPSSRSSARRLCGPVRTRCGHSTNQASPWRHASRPRTRAALAWHCHCVELDEPEKFRANARVALHGLLHLHLPSALPPLPRRLRRLRRLCPSAPPPHALHRLSAPTRPQVGTADTPITERSHIRASVAIIARPQTAPSSASPAWDLAVPLKKMGS